MRLGWVIVSAAIASAVVSALAQSAQRPSGATPAAATAAISGVVKDGMTGRPLAGVVVSLRPPVGSSTAPLIQITRQLTDDRGRFVFRDLPRGEGYSLSTTRPGYVDGAYGQAAMLRPAGAISLRDGQWFSEADIVMWKPGAITGRVLDEFGDPMVGVFVRVLAQQLVAGRPQLLAGPTGVTDDRGMYRVANLPPGAYLIQVPSVQSTVPVDAPAPSGSQDAAMRLLVPQAARQPRTDAVLDPVGPSRLVVGNYATPPPDEGGRAQAYPMTFYPAGSVSANAESIILGLGEERGGIDITVRPVPVSRIFGTMQGPADAIAGLVLRLVPVGLEDLGNGSEAATALVASGGRFAFLNVAAGAYIIDAPRSPLEMTFGAGQSTAVLPQAPGSRLGGSQSGDIASGAPGTGYTRRSGQGEDLYWTRTPVTVEGSDITNLTVALTRSLTLAGRFVYEGTTRVTIEQIPIMGVGVGRPATTTQTTQTTTPRPDRTPPVVAEPANGSPSLGLPRSVFSAEGAVQDTFRIEGLKGGEYVIRVPAGLGRYTIKSITIGGADYTSRPVDASAINGRGEVVITLTDKMTTVSGLVSDDQGVVTNAAVIAFPVERDQWTRYGFTPIRIKAAPVAGRTGYVMKGLPAGTYNFIAVDPSLITAWQDPKFLERAAAAATRVTLEWDETRTVDLKMVRIK